MLSDLSRLLLQSVGTRVLNEARACNHILHALLLYLLKIPLVLQHPAQVLNLAYVANPCLLELQVVLVLQVLVNLGLRVIAGVLLVVCLIR